MKLKKLVIASILSGFVMWTVSGIWHNLIMVKFYEEAAGAEHEGIFVLFIAYLILGGFMSYIYSRMHHGDNLWFAGVIFGMIMGLVWVFPHELAMAGAHAEPLNYVFRNAIWHLVEQAFGGIVIALILGKN